MASTPKIDRRRLMAFAWAWARHTAWARRTGKPAQYLSEALKAAWANERGILAYEAQMAAKLSRPAHVIRAEVEDLENTDRLGWAGIQRLGTLRLTLRDAEAMAA
ncbi:hypothetical protein [Rubellimicrobium roseum]|uniref:Uncharacterized protein n=1 Tax=Rubellimicrobium roseum TaxID=687525 RepID=A0A5C4NHB7_9RHOB|nr:hypothetical protein [Rubellimicrobium roseum]TNC74151.1 hypothetical protein FHG71_02865 [Rubellimicrobium roseum]